MGSLEKRGLEIGKAKADGLARQLEAEIKADSDITGGSEDIDVERDSGDIVISGRSLHRRLIEDSNLRNIAFLMRSAR